MMKEKNKIVLYGHSKDLHNKHSDKKEDFKAVVNEIKNYSKKKNDYIITIKATKYNFFCLDKIINFSEVLLKKKFSSNSLSILPLQKLSKKFQTYVKKENKLLKKHHVKISIDEELLELFSTLKRNANKYNENDLLRLLGIICETTFIGPKQLLIDVKNRCNTNCVYCWIHSPHIKKEMYNKDYYKKSKEIDFDIFKKIINDAAKIKVEDIVLVGDGEPSIHKEFEKMISYINKQGLKTMLFSNGQTLNDSLIKTIVDCNVTNLNFSISAATNSVYKKIHPSVKKNCLSLIKNNLKKLTNYRNKIKKDFPHITLLHVINKLNYKELPAMVKFAIEVGADEVTFQLIDLRDFSTHLKLSKKEIQRVKKDLVIAKELAKKNNIIVRDHLDFQLKNMNSDNGNWSEEVFTKRGCFIGWWFAYYRLDDVFTFCCSIKEVDKLKNTRFEKIWFSKDYETFRVAGKYLSKNKTLEFKDGRKLFENKCDNCDNTGHLNNIQDLLEEYQLKKFLFQEPKTDFLLTMCPQNNPDAPAPALNYISAHLESKGIDHEVLDLNIEVYNHISDDFKTKWNSTEELFWREPYFNNKSKQLLLNEINYCVKKILQKTNKIVGFSVHNANICFTLEVIKEIKKKNPNIKIILGGPSCDDKSLINNISKKIVDYFIIGEGENELITLISSILKNKLPKKRIIKSKLLIKNNHDTITISKKINSKNYMKDVRLIQTSKGCIGSCVFCSDRVTKGQYRTKTSKQVFEEIQHYVNNEGINNFIFTDLACNGDLKKLEQLCDTIINSKLNISWNSFALFRKEMTYSLFKKMRNSGCIHLNLGLESGSNKILKKMKKITTVEIAEDNLRNAKKAGIITFVSFITGFPGETTKDFQETINFIKKNKKKIGQIASINVCYLKNPSELHTNPEKFGIIPSSNPNWWLKWTDINGNIYEERKRRANFLADLVDKEQIRFNREHLFTLEEHTAKKPYKEQINKNTPINNFIKTKKTFNLIINEIKNPFFKQKVQHNLKRNGLFLTLKRIKKYIQNEIKE